MSTLRRTCTFSQETILYQIPSEDFVPICCRTQHAVPDLIVFKWVSLLDTWLACVHFLRPRNVIAYIRSNVGAGEGLSRNICTRLWNSVSAWSGCFYIWWRKLRWKKSIAWVIVLVAWITTKTTLAPASFTNLSNRSAKNWGLTLWHVDICHEQW